MVVEEVLYYIGRAKCSVSVDGKLLCENGE